jgi:hypothetical protein
MSRFEYTFGVATVLMRRKFTTWFRWRTSYIFSATIFVQINSEDKPFSSSAFLCCSWDDKHALRNGSRITNSIVV